MDILNDNSIGVYVVHAPVGYEAAEKYVSNLFAEYNIDFSFVNESELSDIDEAISRYFIPNIKNISSKGVLFCTLSHILCYEQLINDNYDYAIIFEDDPYFLGNFEKEILEIICEMKSLPESFMISLENSILEFPLRKVLVKGKHLYPATHGRCAGAYIIDLAAAKNILKSTETLPCDLVIDWWHNSLSDRGIISHYWAHKPLVEQTSLNGMSSAGKSSRERGWRRRIAWMLQKFYKQNIVYRFR